jgi:hypothetical protein
MNVSAVPTQPGAGDLLRAVRDVTGVLAGVATLVYLTGGLALQLRLGMIRLPSSAAVPQLPREFLVSVGLLIVAPAIAVGFGVAWATRRLGLRRVAPIAAGIGAGVLCYLVIGLLVVSKDPFPAKVCLTDGSEVAGVLIGETGGRTYLGDLPSEHPRRVVSIPQSQVARVVVGGRARQLGLVRCPAPRGA